MTCSRNFLLLLQDLNLLGSFQLLQLLLHRDQQMIFMSQSLTGQSVQSWSNGLVIDDGLG